MRWRRPKSPRSCSTRTANVSKSWCPIPTLSLAIGRRGQNVRLASQLTGWDIDILTEQEESERRQADFENRTTLFMEALDVDEVVGQLLASEGFTSVDELALVDIKEIAGIEGFDEETANELQSRARDYLEPLEAEHDDKRKELGVEDALKTSRASPRRCWWSSARTTSRPSRIWRAAPPTISSAGPSARMAETNASTGILDGFEMSRDDTEGIIMQARVKAGWITEADLAKDREVADEAAG